MRALLLASVLLVSLPALAEPNRLLELLRGHLDAVRGAEKTIESAPEPIPDPMPLVGLTRSEVRAGLGDPSFCRSANHAISEPKPCSDSPSWTYAFYKFVPVQFGGGPELVLQFATGNRVRSAQWWHSQ